MLLLLLLLWPSLHQTQSFYCFTIALTLFVLICTVLLWLFLALLKKYCFTIELVSSFEYVLFYYSLFSL